MIGNCISFITIFIFCNNKNIMYPDYYELLLFLRNYILM